MLSPSSCACGQPPGCPQGPRYAVFRHPSSTKVLVLAALGLALAACVPAAPPSPAYLTDPADPDRPVAPLVYRSVTGGIRTFRPVDPQGWEQQNKTAGENGMGGMGAMPGMDHGSMKGMDHGQMKGMGAPDKGKEENGTKAGGAMDDMKGMGGK